MAFPQPREPFRTSDLVAAVFSKQRVTILARKPGATEEERLMSTRVRQRRLFTVARLMLNVHLS